MGKISKFLFRFILTITIISLVSSLIIPDSSNFVLQISSELNSSVNPSFVINIGRFGVNDGDLNGPESSVINGTHIIVADTGNHRIQIFDLAGNFIQKFGSLGSGDGQFRFPRGVALGGTNIFVVDRNNNRIQVFDLSGNFLSKFGTFGSGDGQFSDPSGITANDTHIFVTDAGNDRIEIFDLSGNFATTFGNFGSGDGQFNTPNRVTTNTSHIFVSDFDNNRIQIFDLSGNFVQKFGTLGSGDGQFTFPVGVAIDNNHIFVVDRDNDRLQIFDLAGNFVTKFGSYGLSGGLFNEPTGVAVNETHIFVADSFNSAIQVYLKNIAPQNLTLYASIDRLSGISLSWSPPTDFSSNSVSAYRIYRGEQSNNLVFISETTNLSYLDTSVLSNQTYYYGISALTFTGESMLSIEVSSESVPFVTVIESQTITQSVTGPTINQTITETGPTETVTGPTTTETGPTVTVDGPEVTSTETITETNASPFSPTFVLGIFILPISIKLKKMVLSS